MKSPTVCAIAAMAAIAGGRRLATATRKFMTDANTREKVEAYLKGGGEMREEGIF